MAFNFDDALKELQNDFYKEFHKELFIGENVHTMSGVPAFSYFEGPVHQTAKVYITTSENEHETFILHRIRVYISTAVLHHRQFFIRGGVLWYLCDGYMDGETYLIELKTLSPVPQMEPSGDLLQDIIDKAYADLWCSDMDEAREWMTHYTDAYEENVPSVEIFACMALYAMAEIYTYQLIGDNVFVWYDQTRDQFGVSTSQWTQLCRGVRDMFEAIACVSKYHRRADIDRDLKKFKEFLVRMNVVDEDIDPWEAKNLWHQSKGWCWDEGMQAYIELTPECAAAWEKDFWKNFP